MNAPEFYSEPQPPDTFLNCWKCGASGRVEDMHGDDYSLGDEGEGPRWSYHCEMCDQEGKRLSEDLYPKVQALIQNALMREGIKFDVERSRSTGVEEGK